jgi:hypothetical protein
LRDFSCRNLHLPAIVKYLEKDFLLPSLVAIGLAPETVLLGPREALLYQEMYAPAHGSIVLTASVIGEVWLLFSARGAGAFLQLTLLSCQLSVGLAASCTGIPLLSNTTLVIRPGQRVVVFEARLPCPALFVRVSRLVQLNVQVQYSRDR